MTISLKLSRETIYSTLKILAGFFAQTVPRFFFSPDNPTARLLFPKLDENSLFDIYDKQQLLPLLKQLKYFCLLRGRLNAYVTDGDALVVDFSYEDREDLFRKFELLGVPLRILSPGEPRLERGKAYPKDLADRLPDPTGRFNEIVQPYVQTVNGERVFILIGDSSFRLSPSEGPDKKEWWKLTYIHP